MQRKPKILWANSYCLLDTASGASISIREILRQLKKHGWDVSILGATVFDSEKGKRWLKDHWANIEGQEYVKIEDGGLTHQLVVTKSVYRSEMSMDEAGRWYNWYVQLLEQYKPDLIFYYGGHPLDFLISDEARMRGLPVAAYLVNGNYSGGRWCRDVDLFITDSHATSDFYQKKIGIKPIPCGKFIDPSKVVVKNRAPKHLLFVNPSLQKGVGIVIQLAMLLEKRRPDIKFEVVESRGDWSTFLKEISTNLGEPRTELSNVIVTPNTNDMRPIYARAKMVLAPSLWWESGSRVLAESMLNGIPAVITDYGGSPEMIGDGGIKIKLPPECHEKPYVRLPKMAVLEIVAQKLIDFYDDEPAYQQLVTKAQQVGNRLHHIEISTRRLIEAFTPLTSKRAGDADFKELQKTAHKHGIYQSSFEPKKAHKKNLLKTPMVNEERGLFIDCGGYDGCSAVKFILQNPQFDSITFEPNPTLWSHYSDVPTTLIKKAAYTHGGTVTFTIDETDADGSSLVESKKIDWHGKVANEECPKIEVGCVDLAELIRRAASQYQKIVLKLDIEGAEYDVLEKLIQEDLVKHLTIIYAEFHWHKCGFPESRHNQLLTALRQQTKVVDWDALDYAVYRRPGEINRQRVELIKQKLGDITRYQLLNLKAIGIDAGDNV